MEYINTNFVITLAQIVYKIQISNMEYINTKFSITFLGYPEIDQIVDIITCKNGTTVEYHVLSQQSQDREHQPDEVGKEFLEHRNVHR